MPQAKDGTVFRLDKFWRGYCTFCGQDANGKQFQGNMDAAVVFIDIQSVDGCMIKAPLGRESVGHNPTDRGKNGDKTQCTDG